MSTPIKLIVGLGNPGPEYDKTRHNAGFWLVEQLADKFDVSLSKAPKFSALSGKFTLDAKVYQLLMPNNYMNHSGQSVQAAAHFFKIPPESILVAHDELDLPCGTIRLKMGGGHGGHNGLRDIVAHLGTTHFPRIRLGIGRPPAGSDVSDYVLNRPSNNDKQIIEQGIDQVLDNLATILSGDFAKAMQVLHTPSD